MPLFFAATSTSFLVSLLSSIMVVRFLDSRIAVLGSFAGLQRSFNEGIAFGINLPGQTILILITLVAVTYMGIKSSDAKLKAVSFGLIVGGGVSNVVDRLMDGKVTDVFQVGSFPIFNVADSCITVGVALLLLEMVAAKGDQRKSSKI